MRGMIQLDREWKVWWLTNGFIGRECSYGR